MANSTQFQWGMFFYRNATYDLPEGMHFENNLSKSLDVLSSTPARILPEQLRIDTSRESRAASVSPRVRSAKSPRSQADDTASNTSSGQFRHQTLLTLGDHADQFKSYQPYSPGDPLDTSEAFIPKNILHKLGCPFRWFTDSLISTAQRVPFQSYGRFQYFSCTPTLSLYTLPLFASNYHT